MDLTRLLAVSTRARARRHLTADDVAFVRDVLPRELAGFPNVKTPGRVRHPAGFTVSGAPVGTFLRSALLLSAERAFGVRYQAIPFYENVGVDLAFKIMRAHFHHGYPKGTYCCAQCTLAVYPVLEAGAIRWFDSRELASSVRKLIEGRKWRFAGSVNAKMIRWSLGLTE